jgi:membrane fusion protein (multidrug efflux system)
LVPNAAIVNRNAKTYVFVAENSTAELIEVKIIDQFGDQTAVQSMDGTYDLSNENVLVSALSRLVDGSSISSQSW